NAVNAASADPSFADEFEEDVLKALPFGNEQSQRHPGRERLDAHRIRIETADMEAVVGDLDLAARRRERTSEGVTVSGIDMHARGRARLEAVESALVDESPVRDDDEPVDGLLHLAQEVR